MNVAAATGDMGILANRVPSIEALRPGLIEVVGSGNASKKWFGCTFGVILFRGEFLPHTRRRTLDFSSRAVCANLQAKYLSPSMQRMIAQHVVPPLMPTVSASPTPNTVDANAVDNPCVRPHVRDANLPGAVQTLQTVSL
ncbi:hypothetical protein C8R48DRAFT_770811 [Suillus tomentosus]|nr:hypothetical protein C8R48DRAFT_770811 [Suillus tomentosus]